MKFTFFKRNIVLTITLIIVVIITGYCIWLNRKPFTQNAFVEANIRTVSAYVPGYLTNIYVKNNEFVKKGTKLLTVFEKPYELKLEKLKKDLDAAKFKSKALEHSINIAKTKVTKFKVTYNNKLYLYNQGKKIEEAISGTDYENRFKDMETAKQDLKMSSEELSIKEYEYKQLIANISSLDAQVKNAELNLKLSTVYAETDGLINNMHLSIGTYVQAGKPLFAFIDTSKWWVQANFTETQLSQVKKGDKAKIWLWQYPGVVFRGVVTDTGWGVNRIGVSQMTAMSEVKKENQWFMLPQRFPVQILITDIPKGFELHTGGSAYVQLDTSAHPIRQFFWRLFQF